jgi:hypothetical protein
VFSTAAASADSNAPGTDKVSSAFRFDFRCGRVDLSVVPVADLRRAYAHAIANDLPEVANITHPFGFPPLREEISRSLLARGIECDQEDILITAGAQQAIDLVARVLIDPGDRVAFESPGYMIGAMAFRNAGAQLVDIDVDDEGLRTDQLARSLARCAPIDSRRSTPPPGRTTSNRCGVERCPQARTARVGGRNPDADPRGRLRLGVSLRGVGATGPQDLGSSGSGDLRRHVFQGDLPPGCGLAIW